MAAFLIHWNHLFLVRQNGEILTVNIHRFWGKGNGVGSKSGEGWRFSEKIRPDLDGDPRNTLNERGGQEIQISCPPCHAASESLGGSRPQRPLFKGGVEDWGDWLHSRYVQVRRGAKSPEGAGIFPAEIELTCRQLVLSYYLTASEYLSYNNATGRWSYYGENKSVAAQRTNRICEAQRQELPGRQV